MSSEEAVIEAQSQRRLTSVSEEEELAATLDVYRLISKDTTRTVMTKTCPPLPFSISCVSN